MRRYSLIVITVICCLNLISCKQDDGITLTPITDDFSAIVNITSTSFLDEDQRFASYAPLDISINDTIEENQDFIIEARLNKLSYEITNYNGDSQTTLTDAVIIIGGISIEIDDLVIQNNLNTENHIVDRYLLNNIAYNFENSTSINTLITGQLSDTSVSFDVIIRMNITVGIDDFDD
ncbi:hypothetical protein [uncultured Winogradskyella sp.]|uniref:hypothetical protein n=1 Tax=uncultured Winogradskyella sp. TaxID=395353 RepID=UPI00262ACD9A|nr:hypothetical protein [uncultured Winogradskyella sp.]